MHWIVSAFVEYKSVTIRIQKNSKIPSNNSKYTKVLRDLTVKHIIESGKSKNILSNATNASGIWRRW